MFPKFLLILQFFSLICTDSNFSDEYYTMTSIKRSIDIQLISQFKQLKQMIENQNTQLDISEEKSKIKFNKCSTNY